MKRCAHCKEEKNETDFYKNKHNKDGLHTECRKCADKRANVYYHSKIKINRVEYNKSRREYYYKNKNDGIKKSYEKRKTKIAAYVRKHRKENPEIVKTMNNKRRLNGSDLTRQTIQTVYEDNIKRFGTLTCYLCLQPIPFGKDHLEHKTPLSRGGTNEYSNLAVACQHCNCSKHNKTEEEYRVLIPLYTRN